MTAENSQSSFHRGAFFILAERVFSKRGDLLSRNPLFIEVHSSSKNNNVSAQKKSSGGRNPLFIEVHSSSEPEITVTGEEKMSQSSFHRGAFFIDAGGDLFEVERNIGRNPLFIEVHSSSGTPATPEEISEAAGRNPLFIEVHSSSHICLTEKQYSAA